MQSILNIYDFLIFIYLVRTADAGGGFRAIALSRHIIT